MCTWVPATVSIPLYIVFNVHEDVMMIINCCLIAIAAIVLTSSNIIIYIIAKRHMAAIMKQRYHSNKDGERRKLKSTYVCISIVATFLVCWLPYLVLCIIIIVHGYGITNDNTTKGVEVVAAFNSIADPILFVLFRRDVKKAFGRVTIGVFPS